MRYKIHFFGETASAHARFDATGAQDGIHNVSAFGPQSMFHVFLFDSQMKNENKNILKVPTRLRLF